MDLMRAAEAGRTDVVLEMLEAGVSPLSVDEMGRTALHKAAFLGLTDMARVLIAHEPAVVAACDVGHNTPLHVVAWAGHVHLTAMLLSHGAAVGAADLGGNTALHRAALEGHADIGEVLLTHGASANAVGSEGSTPLHFVALSACASSAPSFAALLLRYGADPSVPNRYGTTACTLALEQGHEAVARMLLRTPESHHGPARGRREAGGGGGGGSAAEGAHSEEARPDVFTALLGALQSVDLRRTLRVFHSSHRHKFERFASGDYPLELTVLHAQYVSE